MIFIARLKSLTLWPMIVEETLKFSDWESKIIQLVFYED